MPHSLPACPVCKGDRPSSAACPRCGYEELRARPALSLPVGTVLHGEYIVGNPLGKPGGFGITYLAWYAALEQPVAIKEYLPTDLAGRAPDSRTVMCHSLEHEADFRFGIKQFVQEARTLARLSHPNIVRVRGFFEENGTAYLVMDYYAGRSLDRLLEERGGRLPEREAVKILLPILDALQYVHARNVLHRDIKPSNIYLTEDLTPILLDFGAARSALGERTQSSWLLLTPGYAPFEQYHGRGDQGPWTDVYAAAAMLYHLVTGVVPPDAIERSAQDTLVPPEKLVPGLSPGCCRAVLAGLALQVEKRLREAGELRKLLVMPRAVAQPALGGTTVRTKRRFPRRLIVTGGWLVALAFALGVWQLWEKQAQPFVTDEEPLEIPPSGSLPKSIKVLENSVDGLKYIWIPPGTFQMGCTRGDRECAPGENPRHSVEIKEGFWLGQTEVTVAAYRRFATAEKIALPESPDFNKGWAKADQPIVNVDWNDAQAFCEWSGGRLPAEAEWEYGARGGIEGGRYPWGNEPPVCQQGIPNGARFYDDRQYNVSGMEAVRSYTANGHGLYDMAGNVAEWCADEYHHSYYGAPEDGTVWIAGNSIWRVFRGGSSRDSPRNLRVSAYGGGVDGDNFVGFRCARDASPFYFLSTVSRGSRDR